MVQVNFGTDKALRFRGQTIEIEIRRQAIPLAKLYFENPLSSSVGRSSKNI
jgi:hypothetical protein